MPKCMRCMCDFDGQRFCPSCGAEAGRKAAGREQLPAEAILNRRFIIGDVISRDRIGFTYIAWDALLERKVVIKEWFPVKLAEREENGLDVRSGMPEGLWEELCGQFLAQAKKLNRLQDIPVLVPVYTFFQENQTAYYVTEYVEGQTLRQLLQKTNPLESEAAGNLMNRIREALEVFHERGLIHGNLTPDNIFLEPNGGVRFLNPAWFDESMEEIRYTVFRGRYAAACYFEVSGGKEKSGLRLKPHREMDDYSMAAVYYRLLSGEEPVGVYGLRNKERLPSISELGVEVPQKVEKEILRILTKAETKGTGLLRFLQGLNGVLAAAAVILGIVIVL